MEDENELLLISRGIGQHIFILSVSYRPIMPEFNLLFGLFRSFNRGYPSSTESDLLSTLISRAVASDKSLKVHTFLTSDLGVALPLHVSLSRAIGFPKDVKDTFLTSFEQDMKISGIRP